MAARTATPAVSDATPAQQIAGFLAKFDPDVARLIGVLRKDLRARFPTATELVYDNYNFLVFGYCASAKPGSCIVSLAAAANGVGLSFYHGATLADPDGLLQGSGAQNRYLRLPDLAALRAPPVQALIDAAIAQAKVPLPKHGRGATVIQSVSAKQRPRRRV